MRFLTGRALSLSHTFLNDESLLPVTSVAVSVFPEGSDVAVHTATGLVAASGGVYSTVVPPQPKGVYRVVWAATQAVDEERVEVVGGFLFSIPEARESDEELVSASRFPAGRVAHYRGIVETEFQQITARSFTPRRRTIRLIGDGSDSLALGQHDITALISLTMDGEAVTDLTGYEVTESGLLLTPEVVAEGAKVTVVIDYGFTLVPQDIKRAGLHRLRHLLVSERTAIPDRATGFNSADGGYFQLATAGRAGYETGIPDVDAVLNRYRYTVLHSVLGVS